jgi:hypothetical protein
LKKIHLIGTRTRDFPACSIVPQPARLPRAPPLDCIKHKNYKIWKANWDLEITQTSWKSVLYKGKSPNNAEFSISFITKKFRIQEAHKYIHCLPSWNAT